MSGRGRLAVGALLVVLLAGATAFLVREKFFHPLTITAYFPSATGIYAGDEIRVSGVKVGTVGSVQPQPSRARVTLRVDRGVPIPADAKAVIVAQNLVAARYVQLTPAYRRTGPTMRDGAVIGL
ncbi:MlaD family protein, partial [Mycobacterium alsense]|uniref:MlaD family protein n=1 Tax=Mycobacterium alsense TaxID=324058 RepID=UPI000A628781